MSLPDGVPAPGYRHTFQEHNLVLLLVPSSEVASHHRPHQIGNWYAKERTQDSFHIT
jgi:hypothetical protein